MDDARYNAIIEIIFNNDKAIEALEQMAVRAGESFEIISSANRKLNKDLADQANIAAKIHYEKGKALEQEQKDELEAYDIIAKERAKDSADKAKQLAADRKLLEAEHTAQKKVLQNFRDAELAAEKAAGIQSTKALGEKLALERKLRIAAMQQNNSEDRAQASENDSAVRRQLATTEQLNAQKLKSLEATQKLQRAAAKSHNDALLQMDKDRIRDEIAIARAGKLQLSTLMRVGAGASVMTGNYGIGGGMYAGANIAQTMGLTVAAGTAAVAGSLAAVAGAYVYALAQGEKFNVALHDTATLLIDLKPGSEAFNAAMDQMGKDAIKISNLYGTDLIDVMHSFKTALSSGIEVDELEQFGTVAATMATALGTSMDKSIDVLTSFKDNYGLQVTEMSQVSSMLFNTVDIGKVNVETLIKNLGRVIPVARQAGLSMYDMAAGVTTLSRGMNTAQSVTGFTNFIHAMVDPSKKAREEMDRLGIAWGNSAFQGKTLLQVVRNLKEKVGNDAEAMGKIFEDAFGYRGAAGLIGMVELLDKASKGVHKMGTDTEAAGVKMLTFTAQFNKDLTAIWNTITAIGNSKWLAEAYAGLKSNVGVLAAGPLAPLAYGVKKGIREYSDSDRSDMIDDKFDKMREQRIVAVDALITKSNSEMAAKLLEDYKELYAWKYKSEDDLNKHILLLTKERTKAVADLSGLRVLGYNKDAFDPAKQRAEEIRNKEVSYHIRDNQREELAKLEAQVKNLPKAIDNAVDFFSQQGAKELQQMMLEMTLLANGINAMEAGADRELLVKKLETMKEAYNIREHDEQKKIDQYRKSQEALGEIDKKALQDYQDKILGQRSTVETNYANERIAKTRTLELALYTISASYSDKLNVLAERRVKALSKLKQSLSDIDDNDKARRSSDEFKGTDLGRASGIGNWRKLQNELEELKQRMEDAIASGDTKNFEVLKGRAENVYGQYRDARIADGAGAKRFENGGTDSFNAMFGDVIKKGNDKITSEMKTKATKEFQKESNSINREAAAAERAFEDEIKQAQIKGTQADIDNVKATADVDKAVQAANKDIVAKLGENAKAIVTAIGNIKGSGGGSATPPTGTPPPATPPTGTPTPVDPGTPPPATPTPVDPGTETPNPDPGDTSGAFGDAGDSSTTDPTLNAFHGGSGGGSVNVSGLATKTIRYPSLGTPPASSGGSDKGGGVNVYVNATDPNSATKIAQVIGSAMDSYYKTNTVQGAGNNTDIRHNNVYAPVTGQVQRASASFKSSKRF